MSFHENTLAAYHDSIGDALIILLCHRGRAEAQSQHPNKQDDCQHFAFHSGCKQHPTNGKKNRISAEGKVCSEKAESEDSLYVRRETSISPHVTKLKKDS